MKRNVIIPGLIALMVSLSTLWATRYVQENNKIVIEHVNTTPGKKAVLTLDNAGKVVPLDFTETADKVLKAVVHIKSTQTTTRGRNADIPGDFQNQLPDPFRDFFGPDMGNINPRGNNSPGVRVGTGSGVILNEKGYIVTNNHVVENADDLEVTLNDNRTFKASVVGTDPSTDLALLQIKAHDLPYVPLVNSDNIEVGEWVLAVGNPLGLNSTVTAGIVSAKGRSINILKEQFAVESFIQTDAAINPGNSGGALVNLEGGLIGINTAIASPTGSYAGYGFAVPANIVNKVVEDLLTYGTVQRGVLGVMIRSVNGNLAKEKGLDITTGAYVDSLIENGAAMAAGLEKGDVITSVNGVEVKASPELQALVAQNRPGDKIQVAVNRHGKEKTLEVTLKNREGGKDLVAKEHKEMLSLLGAEFENVDAKTAEKLKIDGGVKVKKLYAGKLRQFTNMREGFIITKIDGQKIKSVDSLVKALEGKRGGVMLEGVYEGVPGEHYYALGLNI